SSEDNSKLQPKIQNLKETKGNSSPVIEQFNNTEAEKINSPASTTDISIVRQNWNKLLIGIRPFNHSLSALLSNCQPVSIKNNLLTLATPYDFYRERLNEDKNKLTLEKVFSKILGFNICLCVNLDKSLAPKEEMASADQKSPSEQNSLLDSALEIIGGKIVE
ncbi:hypothetical protein KKF29_01740, partial [Patescibacteria group bacterium]|nr:hypothetical protein [Patescibacteria group bacterium]